MHGHCRECLAKVTAGGKLPLPHHRPTAFNVESLVGSSTPRSSAGNQPVDYSSPSSRLGIPSTPTTAQLTSVRPPINQSVMEAHAAAAYAMHGYGLYTDQKVGNVPGLRGMPITGSPMHSGNGALHYGSPFPWNKLVPQPY